MSFVIYDLIGLAIFCIAVAAFLITHRKNLKTESKIFLLYRTKAGIKTINWFSKRFSKLLDVLEPVSITYGFIAMLFSFYLLIQSIIIMLFSTSLVTKVPPLMPLIPYMPQMFNLPLPPFYFTYWLIVIAIIAVVHEFGHGVYAARHDIKIKSTGFGFLGPFLAAFVEPDEETMKRKTKRKQMAVVSAGSFSNILFAIIFLLLLQLFFIGFYERDGVTGYIYSIERLNLSQIDKIGPYDFSEFIKMNDSEILNFVGDENILVFTYDSQRYLLNKDLLIQINNIKSNSTNKIVLFHDSPAIRTNLSGAIRKLDDKKIEKIEDIEIILKDYSPGETILIETTKNSYNLTLTENPLNKTKGYVGIQFIQLSPVQGFFGSLSAPYFYPYANVTEKISGSKDILIFFRDLFFWLIIILISVSLINMLPLAFLDGGRFIYLAFFSLTKSKKIAERIYSVFSFIVILIFLLLMVIWLFKL